jgi:hypothetical protein
MVATFRPQIESLESRELLAADWFSTYIADPAIANLARAAWNNHGAVNYNDMLSVYAQVEKSGRVTANEFASLQFLAKWGGSYLNTPAPVSYLESQVVGNNPSNRYFEGYSLGNLGVGSYPTQLGELVGKWFLGQDLPAAPGQSYSAVGGSIFGSGGPVYSDVAQGALGDCWLLASLATTANREPSVIRGMFTNNGNNTVTVRFYQSGSPVYVTVNNQLPAGGGAYDHPQNGVLWVALAEKAYAELNTSDLSITSHPGADSYAALDEASAQQTAMALYTITGHSAYYSNNANSVPGQILQGNLAVVGSDSQPASRYVVPSHAYAVLGYNASTGMYTLFNPWGSKSAAAKGVYGVFTANSAFLAHNYAMGAWSSAACDAQATDIGAALIVAEAGTKTTPATAPATRSAPVDAVFAAVPAVTKADAVTSNAIVAAISPRGAAPADDLAGLTDSVFAELAA